MHTHELVIRRGADMVGPDGWLGRVAHVVVDEATREISGLVLQRPDGREWLIPASAVADTTDTTVTLRSGWSDLESLVTPYVVDEFDTLDAAPVVRAAEQPIEAHAPTRRPAMSSPPPGAVAEGQRSQQLRLREEVLVVRKRPQEMGAVELRKEVVAERQTVDAPVWHEELILEYRPVDPPRPSQELIREERTLRVVLREEVATVTRQPVVTEEVRVGRRVVRDTQQVETNIRREEARIEKEGDVDVSGAGSSDVRPG
jgi:uncharacterized protein (TIGR02271 family)